MANDNGAIPSGASGSASCTICTEPVVGCSTIEDASAACRTPYCNEKFATLPKSPKGQILKRVNECLYTDPNNPGDGANLVWQRDKSGNDILAPLSSDMVPAVSGTPCFTQLNDAADGTYGEALIAQVDETNGKTCINGVPIEGTDEAELAGYVLEPICTDATPKVRPVRIEPVDVTDCPENIRFLGAVDIRTVVGTGLERITKGWRWFTSIVQSLVNIPAKTGTEEDVFMEYAVWIKNGECSSLGRLELEDGVLGAWAWCGGKIQFYELPKDETNAYVKNSILAYNGSSTCWYWRTPDSLNERCLQTVSAKPVLATVTATTTKVGYDITSYDPPDCAHYALVEIRVFVSPSANATLRFDVRNYLDDSIYTIAASMLVGDLSTDSNSIILTARCPIFDDGKVYFDYARSGTTGTVQAVLTLTGFSD